jgi:hypothetical protein
MIRSVACPQCGGTIKLEFKPTVPVMKAILAIAERILQERALLKTQLAAAVGRGHEGAHECCTRVQELEAQVDHLQAELAELRAHIGRGA